MRLRELLEVVDNDTIIKYKGEYIKINRGILGEEKEIFKDDFLNNGVYSISIENDCLMVVLDLYLQNRR